jgi:uncharacterized protein YbbC (DUF1343 family)
VTPAFDRYAEQVVTGAQLHVTDHRALDALAVSISMLHLLRTHHPDDFAFLKTPHFDLLAGSAALRDAICAGTDPARIVATWRDDEQAFRARDRVPHLLYPRPPRGTTP